MPQVIFCLVYLHIIEIQSSLIGKLYHHIELFFCSLLSNACLLPTLFYDILLHISTNFDSFKLQVFCSELKC